MGRMLWFESEMSPTGLCVWILVPNLCCFKSWGALRSWVLVTEVKSLGPLKTIPTLDVGWGLCCLYAFMNSSTHVLCCELCKTMTHNSGHYDVKVAHTSINEWDFPKPANGNAEPKTWRPRHSCFLLVPTAGGHPACMLHSLCICPGSDPHR